MRSAWKSFLRNSQGHDGHHWVPQTLYKGSWDPPAAPKVLQTVPEATQALLGCFREYGSQWEDTCSLMKHSNKKKTWPRSMAVACQRTAGRQACDLALRTALSQPLRSMKTKSIRIEDRDMAIPRGLEMERRPWIQCVPRQEIPTRNHIFC